MISKLGLHQFEKSAIIFHWFPFDEKKLKDKRMVGNHE